MANTKTPRIVNFRDIKPNSRNITMIHLDKTQWNRLRPNLKGEKVSALPKRGLRLEFIPDPDGGVVIFPHCDASPDNVCMVVTRRTLQGVTMQCRCRPARRRNGGGTVTPPADPPKPTCRFVLTGSSLRCMSFSNPPCANCVVKMMNFNGRRIMVCSCG